MSDLQVGGRRRSTKGGSYNEEDGGKKFAPELDFRTENRDVPIIIFDQINPYGSNVNNINLAQGSSVAVYFQIPPVNTYYYYDTAYICGQITIPTPANGNSNITAGQGYYLCVNKNAIANQIHFGTLADQFLVSQSNFTPQQINAVGPYLTDYDEFKTKDPFYGAYFPCNQLASQNVYPYSLDSNPTGSITGGDQNYTEDQHLIVSQTPDTGMTYYFKMYLKDIIKPSFFTQRQLVRFPATMQLLWYIPQSNQLCFYSKTPNNIPNGTPLKLTSTVNLPVLSNFYLYIGRETNPSILTKYQEQERRGGITLNIPYCFTQPVSISSGLQYASPVVAAPPGIATGIRRLWSAPYITGVEGTPWNMNSLANVNGSRVRDIRTMLGGIFSTQWPIQGYNPYSSVATPTGTDLLTGKFALDWERMKLIRKNCMIWTLNQFQSNWVYLDSWCDIPFSDHRDERRLLDAFLPKTAYATQFYTLNMNMTNTGSAGYISGITLYCFIEMLRVLRLVTTGPDIGSVLVVPS